MKYFFANLKLYIENKDEYVKLLHQYEELQTKINTELIIIPPTCFLGLESKIFLGAQDFDLTHGGAETGLVSLLSLKNIGISYVLIGHSELRARNENLETRILKFERACSLGITPIYCIGEIKKSSNPHDAWLSVVGEIAMVEEIARAYPEITPIIAYEPLWAIGSKEMVNPTTEHLSFIIERIKSIFNNKNIEVIYGGSVNVNSREILKEVAVDGVLVGRMSLDIKSVEKIIE